MSEIRFNYDSNSHMNQFEILANEDGSGILVIDKRIDDEIPLEKMPAIDQWKIRSLVKDWASYYNDMKQMNEPHPANGEFNRGYVEWLNKQPR